jgi:membrane associated rhomboid family serine protease
MMPITAVVRHLIVINVLVFLGANLILKENAGVLAMHWPMSPYFKPFQIVTHMFMHGSVGHIFFNMFGLYIFGSALEHLWGSKKFLFYYLFSGFGALIIHMLVWYIEVSTMSYEEYEMFLSLPYSVWGASGAIFGLLLGFGVQFPNVRLMLLFLPVPIKAKYFVIIYAVIELYLGVSGTRTGIAHFAHLGGALSGLILILYWRFNSKKID